MAVAVGACGVKRGLFDEDLPSPYSPNSTSKRLRFIGSPARVAAFVPAAELLAGKLAQLRALFPEMDQQQLERALEEAGSDVDSAIRLLEVLRLGGNAVRAEPAPHHAAEASPSAAPEASQSHPQIVAPVPTCSGESQNPAWAEALVQEMSGASDLKDAHTRASALLTKLDEAVTTRVVCAKEEELSILKNQINILTKENTILKRAVTIQNSRQQEQAEREHEVVELRQTVAHYQEQLKNAEMSNYALSMHLQQAMGHTGLGGNGPNSDVF